MKNYTPHSVNVLTPTGEIVSFPPSGETARVAMKSVPSGEEDGVPCVSVEYGDAELPSDHPKNCIVSTMFADAFRAQHPQDDVELFVPDSGPSAVRENGQIKAVRALIRR